MSSFIRVPSIHGIAGRPSGSANPLAAVDAGFRAKLLAERDCCSGGIAD